MTTIGSRSPVEALLTFDSNLAVPFVLQADEVEAILEGGVTYEHQRELADKHVADLADVMANGEWIEGANNLVFAPNGDGRLRLVDGQHRLNAYLRFLEDGGEPFRWCFMRTENIDASTVYGRLDSLEKKRPHSVVATTMGFPKAMGNLIKVCLGAAAYGMVYENGGAWPSLFSAKPGGPKRARTIPYRDRKAWVDGRLNAFTAVKGIFERVPAEYRRARLVMSSARVLPLVVCTIHEDKTGESVERWRKVVHEGDQPLFAEITDKHEMIVRDRPTQVVRYIARAWNGDARKRGTLAPVTVVTPTGKLVI